METKEFEILQKAISGLKEIFNLKIQVQEGNHDFDAILRIGLDEREWIFAVDIKKRITPAAMGVFIQKQHSLQQKENALLAIWHVNPQSADRMKEMGVQFIDAAGNAYINEPPMYIFIKGNKPVDIYPVERPTRAFGPKGLQVVYALLSNPGLEDMPFRKIVDLANTALGTVDWVIRDLKNAGYLIDAGKRGRRLVRKKELLERWVTMYPEQLRPKILEGRYRAPDTGWWKDEDLGELDACWGGEVAAAKMTTGYLKPMVATIYMKKRPVELLLKHRIVQDRNGNIELLKTFWNFKHDGQLPDLVHPILVYADLIATRDKRNIETAGIIYEKEIARFIRED